ncbi:U4/U6.U5 tri-snRNP-associated protein 2 [Patagioenas fasciata monilis]|uniref:U4/U6.U5 tri-snRNP-associated protein 2 n=1 Tax=Patagioenas fasciata monilis TaxID=372326 RepID=A0A1V4KQX5_PATFA|nr:U4/U6.U5 tri-snRNP-associated protein 2 [Patagioenas fasciata monilis]
MGTRGHWEVPPCPPPYAPAGPVRVKREREPDGDSDPEPEPTVRYGRFDPEDQRSRHCPYLDTINKSVLDFDFEKLCSISLSHINVYACLVCGKYFQGRGLKSHAYIHSVQLSHHVFLNLHTLKFYCLPDNYEIIDSSLEDITYVLKPTFTAQQIANLDRQAKLSRAYDGTTYLPGIVGLNNIKANDYANAVLQGDPALGKGHPRVRGGTFPPEGLGATGGPGGDASQDPPPGDPRGPRLFCLEYEGDDGHITAVIVHQGDSAEDVTRRVCARSPLEPPLRRALCQRVQDELSKRRGTG